MDIKMISITELKQYENNPRKHTRDQIDLIKKSIKDFGFTVPILIDENNTIIAGHGRLKAAEKLGLTEVPTIKITHLSEQQIKAYRIADNYLTDESKWDKELLKLELVDLGSFNILKDLKISMDATDITLDRINEGQESGGGYFDAMNEVFIQIGTIIFTIQQSENTKAALDKLKKAKDKKIFGNVIIQAILDYYYQEEKTK